MAKKGKGKKGKSRKGGKRKGAKRSRLTGHKFGIAESLGMAKTALDVGSSVAGPAIKMAITQPSIMNAKMAASVTAAETRRRASPAIAGIVISNCDQLPFIGRALRGPKRKADRVMKKWTGMPL